jgi:putative addiction module component
MARPYPASRKCSNKNWQLFGIGAYRDPGIAETDLEEYHWRMPIVLPLQKMSREEKLRAMEALWADLSKDDDRFESPAWHAQALREAERAMKNGRPTFSDWKEAKKRIRRKAANLV